MNGSEVVQRGYYQYHAVPGNSATLGRFRHRVYLAVVASSGPPQSDGGCDWDRYCAIFDRWIPYPRILHPYPSVRFDAMHPR